MTNVQIEISDADREALRSPGPPRRHDAERVVCTPLPASGLKIVSRPSPSLPWKMLWPSSAPATIWTALKRSRTGASTCVLSRRRGVREIKSFDQTLADVSSFLIFLVKRYFPPEIRDSAPNVDSAFHYSSAPDNG